MENPMLTAKATYDKKAADLLLSKAKIAVMTNMKLAFFSVLMMNMRYRWNEATPYAATNYRTIFLNPVFYATLTPGQRVFLLMHEVCHVAFCHNLRRGARDAKRWNYACDYYINLMLCDHGFEWLGMGLLDEQYRGMNAEQIYDLLPENCGFPAFNFDLLDPPEDEEDQPQPKPEIVEFDMNKLVMQAAMQAQKTCGGQGIPSDVQVFLEKLLNPKLPWHIILKRWFSKYSRKGQTWSRRNKRYADAYMPAKYTPSLANAAFATDISVSVTDDQYNVIASEVSGVFQKMNPDWITYLQFSDKITSVTKVKSVRELKAIKFVGRGGTSVKDLFEWANKEKPTVLVILTDGGIFEWGDLDANGDPLPPACDVVWLIHDNPTFECPFGKIIHYEIGNG
jgi:predicted metal-dependent peptidase